MVKFRKVRFRKRSLVFAILFRFASMNITSQNRSFPINPPLDQKVRNIRSRDVSKILETRGGSSDRSTIEWFAKIIEKASPMLFLVIRESSGFVPPSRPVSPSSVSNPPARPGAQARDLTEGNSPTSKPKESGFRMVEEDVPVLDDPNEFHSNRPVKESTVRSPYLEDPAIITTKDIKRIMTPEDRIIPKDRIDQTQTKNEQLKRAEIGRRIANPKEVFEKIYQGKSCHIFVTVDDEGTARSSIIDTTSKRLLIDTRLNENEYASLQDATSNRFDLTDLRRDVQTNVMNEKSRLEYDSMTRAVLQNQLPAGFKRPADTRSNVDYISLDEKTGYETKRVTQKKNQTFENSAYDIIFNIKKQHAGTTDVSKKYIVDLIETAYDVETQKRIHQHINQKLTNEGIPVDSLIYLFN